MSNKLQLNMKKCEKENCEICDKMIKEQGFHLDPRYIIFLKAGGKMIGYKFKCLVKTIEKEEDVEKIYNEIIEQLQLNNGHVLKGLILSAYENKDNHI